jgi:predicted RNA-binding Zn ribbon-like protein
MHFESCYPFEDGRKTMESTTTRPPPFFVGDHPAMDFLNSLAAPDGERIDWLSGGNDLLDWLEQAKLIDAAAVRRFNAAGGSREIDHAARDARALREWLRGFVEKHKGKPLRPNAFKEMESLNRLLAGGEVYYALEQSATADRHEGNGLCLKRVHRWTKPAQLLQPLGLAIGDLVCHADFRLIRRCENPDCTLIFYDRSKSHARRWCSMAVCGNRAKVAAFRARQK